MMPRSKTRIGLSKNLFLKKHLRTVFQLKSLFLILPLRNPFPTASQRLHPIRLLSSLLRLPAITLLLLLLLPTSPRLPLSRKSSILLQPTLTLTHFLLQAPHVLLMHRVPVIYSGLLAPNRLTRTSRIYTHLVRRLILLAPLPILLAPLLILLAPPLILALPNPLLFRSRPSQSRPSQSQPRFRAFLNRHYQSPSPLHSSSLFLAFLSLAALLRLPLLLRRRLQRYQNYLE